jgi:ABC-type spermidine/putrescine transport system permease subunit II
MFDYAALITLIGFVALMFVPLYIPIIVTVIGGIRRRRENLRQQAVSRHATQAAEPS